MYLKFKLTINEDLGIYNQVFVLKEKAEEFKEAIPTAEQLAGEYDSNFEKIVLPVQ